MTSNVVESLSKDATFEEFLNSSFDAEDYANKVIESQLIGQSLSKLADGIAILNKEILCQVSDHHEDLLLQATGIESLEGTLHTIHSRILSLCKAMDRLRTQVTDPYNRIASRTRQLRRLQTTCEYLRRIIRVLYLSKRLKTQMKAGSREISKAAQSLNELTYVTENVDLTGISVISDELKEMKTAKIAIQNQAKEMMKNGLESLNQGSIGTALQVFYNLDMLKTTIQSYTEKQNDILVDYVRECLDTTSKTASSGVIGPGRVSMPTPGNTTLWRKELWNRFERLISQLVSLCQKIYTLEKVLSKKRDTVTHTSFIELFSEENSSVIFINFWHSICSTLRSEFDHATHSSTHLRQAFELEYPKLLHLLNDFWSQVTNILITTTNQSSTVQNETQIGFGSSDTNELFSELKAACHPFENEYLSRSLSRLLDSVNLVFPNDSPTVPAQDDLHSILKTISAELNVSTVDEKLLVLISKNVLKTIQLYVAKCEQMLITTPDSGQLSGQRTAAQIQNASIVNSLYILYDGINEILSNLIDPPLDAKAALQKAVDSIETFMDVGLSLLLSSVMASLENKISKMHSENFSISMASYQETTEQSCSRYVKDIQDFLERMKGDYFSLYLCEDFIKKRLEALGARLLELFVRHACLLRGLSEGGALKLASDMAQLEFAVTTLCRRFEDLGKPYKLFRAFRPLLFQAVDDIPTNMNIGDTISYSTALHFLFTKAPPQLLSPHTVAGWTVAEYSEWLDDHPDESDRLNLIRGTLEAYMQKIKNESVTKEPLPIYNIMINVLSKSM